MDLLVWKAGFGPGSAGDADFDGDSDGHDFLTWQSNLGMQNAAPAADRAVAAIPEPAALLLLFAAAMPLLARSRR